MGYKSDKSSPVTGDRITNALKGDKQKYRDNWDKVFGKKHVKEDKKRTNQ